MAAPRRMYRPAWGRQIPFDSYAGDGSDLETGQDLAGNPQTVRDPLRVALIEDSCLVREGLTALLGRFSDCEVVVADSNDCATVLAESGPDVALLPIGLGNGGTLGIVRTLRSGYPGLRTVLRDPPAGEDLTGFVRAGVSGFIMPDANLEVAMRTIRSVAAGLNVLPKELVCALFSEIARDAAPNGDWQDPAWDRLTDREREVLDLIAQGSSNKAIASRLCISIHTVKSHLRNTMEKLGLHSRLELAHFVHTRSGVARLDGPVFQEESSTGHPHRTASVSAASASSTNTS